MIYSQLAASVQERKISRRIKKVTLFKRVIIKTFFYVSIIFIEVIVFQGCTGINLRKYVGAGSTHPVSRYEDVGGVFLKGGIFYHVETQDGQFGENARNKSDNYETMNEYCSKSVLGLIAWGNSSIKHAMEKTEITKIHHITHVVRGFGTFIYNDHCLIVYGE